MIPSVPCRTAQGIKISRSWPHSPQISGAEYVYFVIFYVKTAIEVSFRSSHRVSEMAIYTYFALLWMTFQIYKQIIYITFTLCRHIINHLLTSQWYHFYVSAGVAYHMGNHNVKRFRRQYPSVIGYCSDKPLYCSRAGTYPWRAEHINSREDNHNDHHRH